MPEMNGYDATTAIREEEAASGLERTPIMGGDRACAEGATANAASKPAWTTI